MNKSCLNGQFFLSIKKWTFQNILFNDYGESFNALMMKENMRSEFAEESKNKMRKL